MTSDAGPAACLLALLGLLVLTAGVASPAYGVPAGEAADGATAAGEAPPSRAQDDRAALDWFGYRVGEERRYRLEPVDDLRPGEGAEWMIRLAEVRETESGPVATFQLAHERADNRVANLIGGQRREAVLVEGTLQVNADGFPLELEFSERQRISGENPYIGARRQIRYLFRDGEIHKELELGDRDWDFGIRPVRHGSVDLGAPRGIFPFLPSGLSCLEAQGECPHEPAFANPGLLSLMLPTLQELEEQRGDLVFFKPIGFGGNPLGLIDVREWARRERDTRANYRRYFDVLSVRLLESTSVEVGGRQLHAWRLEVEGSTRTVYLQPDGTVLRVDLDASAANAGRRWIELQLPGQ